MIKNHGPKNPPPGRNLGPKFPPHVGRSPKKIWKQFRPYVKMSMDWRLLSKFQIKWKIISNFVAFLENLNFN